MGDESATVLDTSSARKISIRVPYWHVVELIISLFLLYVIMAVGYMWFPGLRVPVDLINFSLPTFNGPATVTAATSLDRTDIWIGIGAQAIMVVLVLGLQLWRVVNERSSIGNLKFNAFFTALFAVGLAVFLTREYLTSTINWWAPIPTVGVLIGLYLATGHGIGVVVKKLTPKPKEE